MTVAATLTRAFAYALTRALPKSRTAVLRGFPPFEDNLIAIYSALESRPIDRIVWVVDNPSVAPPVPLRKNTRLVKKGGFLDLYFSMTSRYLFLTHGHFLRSTPPNQVSVNLWHGIPFKAIGKTMGMEGRSDSFLVATSDFTREAFAQAFGMPDDRIIITGQARTDRMLNVDKQAIWDLAYPGVPRPRQVFLWLPTFRSPPFLGGRTDGEVFHNIFNCKDFSESAFNALLKANDAVCLVKPHPMTARQDHANSSNLFFINETWLQDRTLSLYQLAGAADCLISDVSSIIADFMLLDRPIVLLFEDIEAYKNSRGFSFNPITDFLPAEVAREFDGFMAEMEVVLSGNDPYAARRSDLKRLFFDHTDAGAADRILNHAMGGTS
jgi:CDP-glycerol glycerophosphotransferase